MDARAKFLGHPIHQMMIVLPLGLLGGSVVFDILHLITHNGRWGEIAFWIIAVGVVSGVAAALFGLIDWSAIPKGTRARRVGVWHAAANVAVLFLFAATWLLRRDAPQTPSMMEIALSFVALALAGVSGWLGGELVDRLGVGVHDGAHLDAPSSLSGRSADSVDSKSV